MQSEHKIQDGFPPIRGRNGAHPVSILHGAAQITENTRSQKAEKKIHCNHPVSILLSTTIPSTI